MPVSSSSSSPSPARTGHRRIAGLALLSAAGLMSCSPQYEIDRPGTWHATGVNEQNLRAMAADPRDLYAGNAARSSRGDLSAQAVTRLLVDKRRPLLDATTQQIAAPSGGGNGGGGLGP